MWYFISYQIITSLSSRVKVDYRECLLELKKEECPNKANFIGDLKKHITKDLKDIDPEANVVITSMCPLLFWD